MIIGLSGKKQGGKNTVCKIIQYFLYYHNYLTKKQDVSSTDIQFVMNCIHDNNLDRNLLEQYSGWQRKLFADKLKDIVCLLIGCTREQLEDNGFKEKGLGEEWDKWEVKRLNMHIPPTITYYSTERETEPFSHNIFFTIRKIRMTPRLLLQLLGTECGRQIIHPNIWVNALMSEYKSIEDLPETDPGIIAYVPKYKYPNWIITDVRFPNELQAIKDRGGIVLRVTNPRIESKDEHESETALDNVLWDYYHNIYNDGTIEDLIPKVKDILEYHKII
jgi:hypothetical protein